MNTLEEEWALNINKKKTEYITCKFLLDDVLGRL